MKLFIRFAFFSTIFFATASILQAQISPTKAWDKSFGGTQTDFLKAYDRTTVGGYLLGGFSNSGLTGDKTQPPI